MTKTILACAVAVAALFATGAQADAHGYKPNKPYDVHYYKGKKAKAFKKNNRKAHGYYKARKRIKARRKFRNRYLKWRDRRGPKHRYVRRYH